MTTKRPHKVKVYTAGVFDILHPGHLNILKQARSMGDYLIVGVQEDESVWKQKGQYPAMTCKERMAVIAELPFVDEVVSYANTDQRPLLKKIKPQVFVQGDDWDKAYDRSKIKRHLEQNHIELKLVPYTQSVSSTMIKNRFLQQVLPYRNDTKILKENLRCIELDTLKQYESYDSRRVARLVQRMRKGKTFTDPVVVGHIGGQFILIDGANRVEALLRSGARRVVANVLDYMSPLRVELTNNIHYLKPPLRELLALFDNKGISYKKTSVKNAVQALADKSVVAVVQSGQMCYLVGQHSEIADTVAQINLVVESYIGKMSVFRASELSREDIATTTKISFRKFTKQDIELIVSRGMSLQSGVTWHKVKNSILRIDIPMMLLTRRMSPKAAQQELERFIDKKIKDGHVRYYPSNVYICDEWE